MPFVTTQRKVHMIVNALMVMPEMVSSAMTSMNVRKIVTLVVKIPIVQIFRGALHVSVLMVSSLMVPLRLVIKLPLVLTLMNAISELIIAKETKSVKIWSAHLNAIVQ